MRTNAERPIALILRRGDRSSALPSIREQLIRSGSQISHLSPADVDNPELFDDHVDAAVRAFQQDRGLLVDGVIGPQTVRALDSAHWALGDRILRFDPVRILQGDDVVSLQKRLRDLGVFTGQVDGMLGVETEAALRELQRGLGLTADGVCGPATLRGISKLGRAVTGGNPFAMHEAERVVSAGSSLAGKVIVIESGGEKPSAGNGLLESNVAADVARRLEGRLSAVGAAAIATTDASAMSAALSEDVVADIYLSIRCDASPSAEPNGFATFYYGKDNDAADASPIGASLAGLIQREVIARTDLLDCRSHARSWDVLRRVPMPAVQLAVGYLSNPGDARRLADPAFRDTVAEAVLAAIQRLYLPEDDDRPTGTLRVDEVLAYTRRK
ncbi:peptidoglycan-binding protein [Saxibacter everestensis]|uniref:Peptidoglycan-binding protein n=1 Tax=Saxibacter everestensis TaxID=2909229 RepID=A0ABY8QS16_9MICO|nr:peptidoglycan-binding protein [Brevibacteriaceae bacterium ZFBP1038]